MRLKPTEDVRPVTDFRKPAAAILGRTTVGELKVGRRARFPLSGRKAPELRGTRCGR